MGHTLLIVLLTSGAFIAQGQTIKIENNIIWHALYPGNNNYDKENRLIRKANRDGAEIKFRTEIGKIFYYKVGTQEKASVILFSYDYSSGQRSDCHACSPEFEIAGFALSNNEWIKQKFVQHWEEGTGSWGEPAEIEFKVYNNINCLEMTSSYGNQGSFETTVNYYNIESLKKIKSIKK